MLLAAAALLLFAQLSFDRNDIAALTTSPNKPLHNWIGWLGAHFAWIFFLAFILLATFTVLNLFIAVIVNAMQEPHTPVEHRPVATSEDIARLRAEIAELRRTLGHLKLKG